MKTWILSLSAVLLFMDTTYGQKVEMHLNAFGGLSYFSGPGSAATSPMTVEIIPAAVMSETLRNSLWNAHGRRPGFSYAAEAQVQKVTGKGFLFGSALAFEVLKNKATVNYIHPGVYSSALFPAEGEGVARHHFLTLTPLFAGMRFSAGNTSFDCTLGAELGFLLRVRESGRAVSSFNSTTYSFNNSYGRRLTDTRLRLQVRAQIDRYGILAGYSLGLKNYDHPGTKAYSNFVRMGISYRLL